MRYGIKSERPVIDWVNNYREFGEAGLLCKRQRQTYSVQFELDAIALYLTSGLSYRKVSNELGMNNRSLIVNWMSNYREQGIDGLSQMKGCPSTMPKKTEKLRKLSSE